MNHELCTMNPDLSIVIPIYNEQECVKKLYERVHDEAVKLGRSYEIILIDDGSSDKTPEILKQLVSGTNDLRVIRFRKNYGQTPAMVAGFDHARGDIIITMDGDLQNDPADMKKLLDKMDEGYEVVSGWRYKRQDKFLTRKLPSMCANKLISILTGVHLHDYGCSLKAYKRECIREVQAYAEMHRFFPAVASITGARTAEMPVNHYARVYGKSKYGLSRTFKVFADLFTMVLLTRFSTKPALFFAFWTLPFLALSVLCLIATIEHYIFAHTPGIVFPGATLLMLMLVTHFIFLALLSVIILRQGKYKAEKLSTVTAEIIK
ncbi:MAG: glycosyltransferase family 2 protein [Candidatus Omnitrophica bacterium]|nr:glycosyltransferase family 2 protein [Candidatus Omnitrophota bacterium]